MGRLEHLMSQVERLLMSEDKASQTLALEILSGAELGDPEIKELIPLWMTLIMEPGKVRSQWHQPQLTDNERLAGKILGLILKQNHSKEALRLLESFVSHDRLRLPYCALEAIPEILFSLENIKEIIWQEGELLRLDERLLHFKGLERLDLRRQPIEFISPALAELKNLKELHLISTSFLPQELSEKQDLEVYTDAPY